MIRALLSLAIACGLLAGAAWAAEGQKSVPKKQPKPVEELFQARDFNGDGKITLEEFTSKAKDNKDLAAKQEKRFKILDTNHDGSVTLEEFKAAREQAAKKAAPAPKMKKAPPAGHVRKAPHRGNHRGHRHPRHR